MSDDTVNPLRSARFAGNPSSSGAKVGISLDLAGIAGAAGPGFVLAGFELDVPIFDRPDIVE